MLATVIEILNYITISQLLLFCVFFLTRKQDNKLSDKLLALLFLCYALWLTTEFTNLRYVNFFLDHAPHLIWTLEPFAACISPLLYLYTLSLIKNDFKLKPKHVILFIPFIVFSYFVLTKFTFQDSSLIREKVSKHIYLGHYEVMFTYGTVRLMNLFLAAISLIAIFKFKKRKKYLLSDQAKFELKWQLIILSGISIVFIFEAINYIYFYYNNYKYTPLRDIIFFIMFIIFNSLIYSGLKKSTLFEPMGTNLKYSKSPLLNEQKELLMLKLMKSMVEDKIYLTPSITVQDIAEIMDVQPRQVSQVINELAGQNFIDFINTYRIEEAKKMLANPKYKKYSIIGILYEAGFNSKTAFNTAFKKQTGCTPKEYKLMNENKLIKQKA
jgi:AraC-like DNA-binding protein